MLAAKFDQINAGRREFDRAKSLYQPEEHLAVRERHQPGNRRGNEPAGFGLADVHIRVHVTEPTAQVSHHTHLWLHVRVRARRDAVEGPEEIDLSTVPGDDF